MIFGILLIKGKYILKKYIFIILLIFTVVFISGEEIGNLSISLIPGASLPLGDSTLYYTAGGGAGLSANLRLNSLTLLFFKLDTAYFYIPIRTKDGVSIYSATACISAFFIVLVPILTMSGCSDTMLQDIQSKILIDELSDLSYRDMFSLRVLQTVRIHRLMEQTALSTIFLIFQ